MNTKETKQNIIQAGRKAVDELIKVAKEPIVDSDDDISADRLKNAAAHKKACDLRRLRDIKQNPRRRESFRRQST